MLLVLCVPCPVLSVLCFAFLFLQWDKRLEMGVKSVGLIAGQQTPTIISPHNYKQRFRLAMDRYFMSSPDHASKLSMLAVGNNAATNNNDSSNNSANSANSGNNPNQADKAER
jgi:hypothetical protein